LLKNEKLNEPLTPINGVVFRGMGSENVLYVKDVEIGFNDVDSYRFTLDASDPELVVKSYLYALNRGDYAKMKSLAPECMHDEVDDIAMMAQWGIKVLARYVSMSYDNDHDVTVTVEIKQWDTRSNPDDAPWKSLEMEIIRSADGRWAIDG